MPETQRTGAHPAETELIVDKIGRSRHAAHTTAVSEETTCNPTNPDSLIAAPVVRQRCGDISRVTLWRHVRAGILPAPVRVGGRVLWSAREIDAWIADRLAARESVDRG